MRTCIIALTIGLVSSLALGDESPTFLELIDSGLIESNVNEQPLSTTTLNDLESIALASHPAISVARAQVNAVRGQYVQAGLKFNPVLQYQGDEIGNEDAAGFHSINVSQQFVTANKLGIARQVQAQAIQKQLAQAQLAELRVLTNLRTVYAQTLVAQARVDLVDEMVRLTENSFESVESLYEAEEVSKVSVLQARVEAERTRIAAEVAETELVAQRRSLAAAVGIRQLTADRVTGALDDGLVDQPWESLIEMINAASPELAVAGSELERARWALQSACANAIPNVTGQVGIGRDSVTNDVFPTISISMPLPVHNRNQGNIRTARANIRVAEASIDRTRIDLESRLATAVGRYQTSRRRYQRLSEKIIPDAEETFELSQEAFEAGESSYLQLLASQRTLINTRLQALEAIGEARQTMAEIEGMLVTLGK